MDNCSQQLCIVAKILPHNTLNECVRFQFRNITSNIYEHTNIYCIILNGKSKFKYPYNIHNDVYCIKISRER